MRGVRAGRDRCRQRELSLSLSQVTTPPQARPPPRGSLLVGLAARAGRRPPLCPRGSGLAWPESLASSRLACPHGMVREHGLRARAGRSFSC